DRPPLPRRIPMQRDRAQRGRIPRGVRRPTPGPDVARPGETGEHLVTPEVLVVGSVSRDVTVTVDRFPAPGETVVGHSVSYGLGGKGANQAVASALTGVPTSFLG